MKKETQIIVLLFAAFLVDAILALLTHMPTLIRVMPVIMFGLLVYIGWLLITAMTKKKPADPNRQPQPPNRHARKKTK